MINCNNRWSAECYSSQKIVLIAWLYVHHFLNSNSNMIFIETAAPLLQEMMRIPESKLLAIFYRNLSYINNIIYTI